MAGSKQAMFLSISTGLNRILSKEGGAEIRYRDVLPLIVAICLTGNMTGDLSAGPKQEAGAEPLTPTLEDGGHYLFIGFCL